MPTRPAKPTTCKRCPRRSTCTTLCPQIEAQLEPEVSTYQFGNSLAILGPFIEGNRRQDAIDTHRATLDSVATRIRSIPHRTNRYNHRRYAQVAELRYWQGLSTAQIAARLNVTEKRIREMLVFIAALQPTQGKRGESHKE